MKCVVEFKDEYKDDIARCASLGVMVSKHPNFNLSNEIGIFVNTNKILKSQYKFYVSLDSKNNPNGAICIDKQGDVLLLATAKSETEDSLTKLLQKCDELLAQKKYGSIIARVDVKFILSFNDAGYKTIKFLEDETSQFKFLVKKVLKN